MPLGQVLLFRNKTYFSIIFQTKKSALSIKSCFSLMFALLHSTHLHSAGQKHEAQNLSYIYVYEGESISNQPIPFPMDRDRHDFHALFQYMFYIWVQNCTRIESFFNKILNVKHG